MSGFVEEFYYGNIDPQAHSFEQNKAVQKCMQILTDSEDYLTKELEELDGESLKKFLDFVNAWSIVNSESNLDSFITGFRLGAQFTMDTFVATAAPYTDYLKEA